MSYPIVGPLIRFYSERVGGRPFCRCMSAGISPVLRFEGYDIPKSFPVTLYAASGVSGCGMSFNDQLIPTAPVTFGQLDVADLWKLLRVPRRINRKKGTALVQVHMSKLPHYLQTLVGMHWINDHPYPRDKHGICLAGKRHYNGGEVLWMDPMGQAWKGYSGVWVPWTDVKDALVTGSQGVKVAYGLKGSAV